MNYHYAIGSGNQHASKFVSLAASMEDELSVHRMQEWKLGRENACMRASGH